MNAAIPSRLSDRELEAEVARLAGCEREATASLIAHLAELYGRRLHERAGFSSLFTYCTDVLRLSEHEAYDRMKAAKVVRRYSGVLTLLVSGRVNLTTVRLLAPHLTRKNQEELFSAASGKSKRQVQELLARRYPKADVASSVRKLPSPMVTPVPGPTPVGASAGTAAVEAPWTNGSDERAVAAANAAATSAGEAAPRARIPEPPRPIVQPLSPDRYRVTFTANAEMCEKLQLAQDLLRHAVPGGDLAQVFARALDALVDALVKQKFAVTSRPATSRGQADDSRNIPAEVKRGAFIRDCGRCAFVGPHGRRCGERAFLEFHHLVPYAVGGRPTLDNIDLRCRAHNGYEAEQFFGPCRAWMGTEAVTEAGAPDGRVTHDAFRSGTKLTNDRMPGTVVPPS
ncbi:MAG TPA: HNH endonuclease signature motif containing protein [Vicinamibacteria bacterium]